MGKKLVGYFNGEESQGFSSDGRVCKQPLSHLEENSALQAALETLILQTTLQLYDQIEFLPYLSKKHRLRISQSLQRLEMKVKNILASEDEGMD